MEEEKKEEQEDAATEETSPEEQEQSEETEEESEESTDDSQNIDYKKELETLEESHPKEKSEIEKAERALYFNAKRFEELGGDPSAVIQPKKEETDDSDPASIARRTVQETLAEQKVRELAKSEDEFNLIMWRVRNQGLSVDEAHLLANKGRILKRESEEKRSNAPKSLGGGAGQRVQTVEVPGRSDEEKKVLERRGLKYNDKTKTWQGKHTEEYWDGEQWRSRRRTS